MDIAKVIEIITHTEKAKFVLEGVGENVITTRQLYEIIGGSLERDIAEKPKKLERSVHYKGDMFTKFLCAECQESVLYNQNYCDHCGKKQDWKDVD